VERAPAVLEVGGGGFGCHVGQRPRSIDAHNNGSGRRHGKADLAKLKGLSAEKSVEGDVKARAGDRFDDKCVPVLPARHPVCPTYRR
jgi:hypothetical protein